MARARNIKPGFFQNEQLGDMSPLARLLFIGMWTIADFKGCIEYRPKRLKIQLLPYDECNIEELVQNLSKDGFIRIYSVQGQMYIKVVNFDNHQNPHKNERDAGSKIPDVDKSDSEINILSNIGTTSDKIGTARADSLLLIPDSLNTDSLIPEVVAEKLPQPTDPEKAETELQAACRVVWKSYSDAYFNRYGTEPVRNAKVNSLVKQFVQRIGADESPGVAAYFVGNNNSYYVGRAHVLDCLVSDAEKLRMEWATGSKISQSEARRMDKTQGNLSAVEQARALLAAGGD